MTINTYQNRMQMGFGTNRIQKLTETQLEEIRKAKQIQQDRPYNKEDIEMKTSGK